MPKTLGEPLENRLPAVIAKTLVLNQQGLALVLRRAIADLSRPGEQDLPGGGIYPGEDITEGAAREVFEESRLEVYPSEMRLMYTDKRRSEQTGRDIVRLLFLADQVSGDVVLSHEHDAHQWVEPSTVPELLGHKVWTPGVQSVLDRVA